VKRTRISNRTGEQKGGGSGGAAFWWGWYRAMGGAVGKRKGRGTIMGEKQQRRLGEK